MEEANKLSTIMECNAGYALKEDNGQEIAKGACNLLLDSEKLTILPESGEPLLIPFRDIIRIKKGNYRMEIELVSRENITLFDLGYKFEDFYRNFSNLNNEVVLNDLLMTEALIKSGVEADFNYIDENKIEKPKGSCELRIYETGLVIISEEGDFIRIPHSDLTQVQNENYKLVLKTDYGESYIFSKMGIELDKCFKALNEMVNALSTKTQMSLKELFPNYDSSIIRKTARLMKDGRAARRVDIDAISPGIWHELEKRLEVYGIHKEYEYLKSIAQAERICIGIKRGLMGDLTGEYIWFLAPIFNSDPAQPGNAIAMEAAGIEGGGKATYFFKITEPDKYLGLKNIDDMRIETDNAIKKINRDLISINFRREPIYLSDEQLQAPEYLKYRRAIEKIPALRELRHFFIGRTIHYSSDQWKNAVMQLLENNARVR
jgi:hypothetical protein